MNAFGIKGLTNEEVIKARASYGTNKLTYKKENALLEALKSLVKEPNGSFTSGGIDYIFC